MEDKNVKYCVCAYIDLLGYAAHLEVGADLRTTIGQQAIQRLRNLDDVIDIIEGEKLKNPDSYPKYLDIRRINDALILTLDLPATLNPSIGDKAPYNYNHESNELLQARINEIVDPNERASKALEKHAEVIKESVQELMIFVGLVSRIHSFIFYKESSSHFPGPKTIIVTGYRHSYTHRGKEDFLSANFAFSNAFKAESKLKGSALYVDDTILRLLSVSTKSLTVIRHSLLIAQETGFNPYKEPLTDVVNDFNQIMYFPVEWVEAIPMVVELFRTEFIFRELNPQPLVLLQLLFHLEPYLKGEKTASTNPILRPTIELLRKKQSFEDIKSKPRPMLLVYPSLDKDIGELLNDFVNSQSAEYCHTSQ